MRRERPKLDFPFLESALYRITEFTAQSMSSVAGNCLKALRGNSEAVIELIEVNYSGTKYGSIIVVVPVCLNATFLLDCCSRVCPCSLA